MDIYSLGLALGGGGLVLMALGGVGRHGGQHGHGSHAHGHAHGGHAHAGHAHVHADLHARVHGARVQTSSRAPGSRTEPHASELSTGGAASSALLWTLATPRILFAVLLGFGAAGMLLRGVLGGVVLFVAALIAGVAFERLAIRPLMNLLLGFASSPAVTLESALFDEARAASGFDANGEGLIAVDVDGQVVQLLGTLRSEDRQLGVRVRAGDRLRIEDVDSEKHRCTVSFLGRP
jgi:hypothetical protein